MCAANRGREAQAWVTYTHDHYDSLPDNIFFIPLPFTTRHPDRKEILLPDLASTIARLLSLASTHSPLSFTCLGWARNGTRVAEAPGSCLNGEMHLLGDAGGCYCPEPCPNCTHFHLSTYHEMPLVRADPPLLHEWVREHLGNEAHAAMCNGLICTQGAFSTTSANLLAWPRRVFADILAQFNSIDLEMAGEIDHFLERAAQLVFGFASVPKVPRCLGS